MLMHIFGITFSEPPILSLFWLTSAGGVQKGGFQLLQLQQVDWVIKNLIMSYKREGRAALHPPCSGPSI